MLPISAKKCKKCKILSGIFALKFCEYQRFFSRQKLAFLFPAKNRRQLQVRAPRSGTSHKERRKLAVFRRRTFFCFGDQHKIREKDASISTMTFFFLEITLKLDKRDEKNFRHFYVEFRTFALFPVFSQEVKLRGNTGQFRTKFQFSISIYRPSTSKLALSTVFLHLDIRLILATPWFSTQTGS